VCGSAELLAIQCNTSVDEVEVSVYFTVDILATFPESTAPRAEAEDLSTGDDDDQMMSSERRGHQVARSDTTANVVMTSDEDCYEDNDRLTSGDTSCEMYGEGLSTAGDVARQNLWADPQKADDVAICENGRTEYYSSPGMNRAMEYAAADSPHTLFCGDGIDVVSPQMLDGKNPETSACAAVAEVDPDLQNSSVVAAPMDSNSKGYCEANKLISQHASDEKDYEVRISSAVGEVDHNLEMISRSGDVTSVRNGSADGRVYHDESEEFRRDDRRHCTELLSAYEETSNSRYVSSLYVTLAAESGCTKDDDEPCLIDVSKPSSRRSDNSCWSRVLLHVQPPPSLPVDRTPALRR